MATTRAPEVARPLPTPPDTASAVAGPWPLKLTDVASPVLPATPAPGRPVAGIAVAEALPPKDTATAAEQSQPLELQPSEASTKAETASLVAASDSSVALREGVDGLSGAPPLSTPEPGVADVLTGSDGALLATLEAGAEAVAELAGADGVTATEVGGIELVTEGLPAVVEDSGTEPADAKPRPAVGTELGTCDEMEVCAVLEACKAAVPAAESLAPAELVSTALVTISSVAEPVTAAARQPTANRSRGSFIFAPVTMRCRDDARH